MKRIIIVMAIITALLSGTAQAREATAAEKLIMAQYALEMISCSSRANAVDCVTALKMATARVKRGDYTTPFNRYIQLAAGLIYKPQFAHNPGMIRLCLATHVVKTNARGYPIVSRSKIDITNLRGGLATVHNCKNVGLQILRGNPVSKEHGLKSKTQA